MDYDRLREDLMDYYGTAMTGGMPMAVMDLIKVENASPEELAKLAEELGIDVEELE